MWRNELDMWHFITTYKQRGSSLAFLVPTLSSLNDTSASFVWQHSWPNYVDQCLALKPSKYVIPFRCRVFLRLWRPISSWRVVLAGKSYKSDRYLTLNHISNTVHRLRIISSSRNATFFLMPMGMYNAQSTKLAINPVRANQCVPRQRIHFYLCVKSLSTGR